MIEFPVGGGEQDAPELVVEFGIPFFGGVGNVSVGQPLRKVE
jgi:hypothetical protein